MNAPTKRCGCFARVIYICNAQKQVIYCFSYKELVTCFKFMEVRLDSQYDGIW